MNTPSHHRLGVYAGSFDPPTNGHLWMIEEGSRLFDKLIVAVGVNPQKKPTFPLSERLEFLKAIVKGFDNIETAAYENEFLANYARRVGATHILRGIRGAKDFEYEHTFRHINGDMNGDVTTVFLTPPRNLEEISSSTVLALIGPHGWREVVSKMVPAPVAQALEEKFKHL
jgi:pantetheine-phosphate adenylyltransferase